MNHKDQTFHFADELDKLCERFTQEYDLTYAQAVGVLTMKIHLLCSEAGENSGEELPGHES